MHAWCALAAYCKNASKAAFKLIEGVASEVQDEIFRAVDKEFGENRRITKHVRDAVSLLQFTIITDDNVFTHDHGAGAHGIHE